MKKKCGWCGNYKEVFAYKEKDYEEVKNVPKEDLLIENVSRRLRDNDVVGLPICNECYDEITGET